MDSLPSAWSGPFSTEARASTGSQKAVHDGRAAEAEAAVTRDQIENGIWTAYSNLKTALRQRETAAALLQAADQSYNAALESYRYGVRNLVDVTVAQ